MQSGFWKVYWHGRASGKHFHCSQGRQRKTGDGVCHRNESRHHPGMHPRNTGQLMGGLRGRDQCRLAVRPAQAARGPIVVCDPRKNALLKTGNKNDRVDARKLSDLLRAGLLTAVYHGESGVRTLRELSRSYLTVTKDLTRVMNRLKALYRSWAIPCAGEKVYSPRHRSAWLEQLSESGVRRR